MTPHGIVTGATLADAEECALNLRPEDRRELEDLTGHPALDSLKRGVLLGAPSLTLRTLDGTLAAILTVVPYGERAGVVGMSGTKALEENTFATLRGSKDVLRHIDARFDTLFNVCDARNEVHIKWLRWLGFTFIRKIDRYGQGGVPVYEFARIRTNV
jgi:hypothetical protein